MKISVVMDGRFDYYEGVAYSSHMSYEQFAIRFLHVFDGVDIFARAYSNDIPSGSAVDGDRAQFIRIGNYRGIRQFVCQAPALLTTLWRISGEKNPIIAYLPGTLSILVGYMRLARARPLYALVVADPADQLAKGAMKHPLRGMVRYIFRISTKYLLKQSAAAMYVTKDYLQDRYPTSTKNEFATSDVFIPDDSISPAREPEAFDHQPLKLLYVAMMAQHYKGHDNLLSALSIADNACPGNFHLTLVGDGPLRQSIERIAKELQVDKHVTFAGKVPHGSKMNEQLDAADIFVMASRAEGLPRAMVEAMSRGLPVLSTRVGGVPELLRDECMFGCDDPTTLAQGIVEASSSPERLSRLSRENVETAKGFRFSEVEAKILRFYDFVRRDYVDA